MLSKECIDELKEQYKKMNSMESIELAEKVFLEFGKKIQEEFPGVEFLLKARIKSKNSHDGKIERLNKKKDGETQIYDDIGMCLIIKNVKDDFYFNHKLCEMFIKERIEIDLEIENEKSRFKLLKEQYNDIIIHLKNKDKLVAKIEKLKQSKEQDEETINLLEESLEDKIILENLAKNLFKEILNKSERFEKFGKKYKKSINNKINEMIGTHIMNKLTNDKEFMNFLGLKVLDNRKKFHDGGKSGYYRAYHDAVGSIVLEYWKMEVQSLSEENYARSKKDHFLGEGKARTLPIKDNAELFKKNVLNSLPKNFIYQNIEYDNEGNEIKPAKIYKCSDVENLIYYYLDVLLDKKEERLLENKRDLLYELISDKSLFSDEGTLIENDSNTNGKIIHTTLSNDKELEL